MRLRLVKSLASSLVLAPLLLLSQSVQVSGASALTTPWGDPDLQGIWTDETDTPLQRPAKYANQEFFTPEQRAELDKERAAALGRDRRGPRGSERDVLGAYTAEFASVKRTGTRTSMTIVLKD